MEARRTSGKTMEDCFKGTAKQLFVSKERYSRGQVARYAQGIIKKVSDGDLVATDKELAAMTVNKFGGATSVKSIQWYRHQMRQEGLLPAAKQRAARSYITELIYEVIDTDGSVESLTAKKLIAFGRAECIKDGADKQTAHETVYSIGSAAAFLVNLGFQIIDQNNYEQLFEEN